MAHFGQAAITWSVTSQTQVERVHLLEAPLRDPRLEVSGQTVQRRSMDRTVVENIFIGAPANEFVGKARYDKNPQSLIDLIVAGSQGKTLSYWPDVADDVAYACDLIAPLSPAGINTDPDRSLLGDHSVELRLAKTDQTEFTPTQQETGALFVFHAGASLQASTFSRATTAGAVLRLVGDKGYGSLVEQSTNEPRLEWTSTAIKTDTRPRPTLLIESSGENFIANPLDLSAWSAGAATTLTSEQTAPSNSTDGWRLANTAGPTTVTGVITDGVSGMASAEPHVISVFLAPNTNTRSSQESIVGFDSAGTEFVKLFVKWPPGALPEQSFSGTQGTSVAEPERIRDGFFRFQIMTTGGAYTTGNVTIQAGTADNDSVDVYGVMVEQI